MPHQVEIALSHNQSGQSLQYQWTKIFNTNKTFLHNGNCLCFFGCLLIIIYFISYKIYKTFSHSTFPDHFSELAILVYIFQMNFKFPPIRNFFLCSWILYLKHGLNSSVSPLSTHHCRSCNIITEVHAILRGIDSPKILYELLPVGPQTHVCVVNGKSSIENCPQDIRN